MMWNDQNRFNQSGYSSKTIYPSQTNYVSMVAYLEDLEKAKARDEDREDWLEELRMDAQSDECCYDEEYEEGDL